MQISLKFNLVYGFLDLSMIWTNIYQPFLHDDLSFIVPDMKSRSEDAFEIAVKCTLTSSVDVNSVPSLFRFTLVILIWRLLFQVAFEQLVRLRCDLKLKLQQHCKVCVWNLTWQRTSKKLCFAKPIRNLVNKFQFSHIWRKEVKDLSMFFRHRWRIRPKNLHF